MEQRDYIIREKALYLLLWVDEEGKTFSFERQEKIMSLKSKI